MRRIGVLMGLAESDPRAQARAASFRKGLQTLGWAEGRNARIDIRWTTTSDAPALQRFAKVLVALQPDVIVSQNTPTTAALRQHTSTIRQRARTEAIERADETIIPQVFVRGRTRRAHPARLSPHGRQEPGAAARVR
jgi:hypothetical protein